MVDGRLKGVDSDGSYLLADLMDLDEFLFIKAFDIL